jgi:hypothetical protein
VAVGDVNSDGRLDLVVANNGSNTVTVLLGKSGGGFRRLDRCTGGIGPTSGVLADFNRDGRLDLVVANYSSNTIAMMTNGFAIVSVEPSQAPRQHFTLSAPWPNPAHARIRFSFVLPEVATVCLDVFDVGGRCVARLARDRELTAGAHSLEWDGRLSGTNAPNGVYFARLRTGSHSAIERFVLLSR